MMVGVLVVLRASDKKMLRYTFYLTSALQRCRHLAPSLLPSQTMSPRKTAYHEIDYFKGKGKRFKLVSILVISFKFSFLFCIVRLFSNTDFLYCWCGYIHWLHLRRHLV